ncbi:MAG: GNAT family N-acetyltransferase [Candidatus Limnocylindria bacterium]
MATDVRRATRDDIPALADVLADALIDDPYFGFIVSDAPERRQRMREGWRGILRFGSADLVETYTTRERAGAAIWMPPGHRGPSVLASMRMMPAMARLAGWRRLRTVASAMAALEERHRHHAPGDHFYLSAFGVDPPHQGVGIGTALARPVLDRCNAEGIAAYLETATARNVLLYERLGFEVVEELTLPGTDVRGWLMLRAGTGRG